MRAAWQATITNEAGAVQPGAQIEVRSELTSGLVALFSDRDGTTPLANPFNADEQGFARFYVAGGAYRIVATKGEFSRAWRHVPLGLLSEKDDLTQADIGARLYPRTPAEQAAGVTPTNYAYPPGNVLRYGTSDAIQTAINAAGSTGSVVIPGEYTGTDSYTSNYNVPVTDLRNAQLGIWSVISPGLNVGGGAGVFPQGNDLVLRCAGPADLYIEHLHCFTTTDAALSVGANPSVLVGAFTVGSALRGAVRSGTTAVLSTDAPIVLDRGTADEEEVPVGQWSIIDGTHLSINCAKAHSGTTDVEQIGSTLLASQDLYIVPSAVKPSQMTTTNPQLRVKDLHGDRLCSIPSDMQAPTPDSLWTFAAIIGGDQGANDDLLFQHATSNSKVKWRDSTGTEIASLNNSGHLSVSGGISAGTGKATTNGQNGEVQLGRVSGTISSTADVFVSWQDTADPLNPSATAGSLGLFARNASNTEVNIGAQGAVNIRISGAKLGFYGTTPVTKPTVSGSRGGNAALASLLTALANLGLITDSTSA